MNNDKARYISEYLLGDYSLQREDTADELIDGFIELYGKKWVKVNVPLFEKGLEITYYDIEQYIEEYWEEQDE